jgi:hypothetical protein
VTLSRALCLGSPMKVPNQRVRRVQDSVTGSTSAASGRWRTQRAAFSWG